MRSCVQAGVVKTVGRLWAAREKSGRGQPHSKTCRNPHALRNARSVLECGCPLPLSLAGASDRHFQSHPFKAHHFVCSLLLAVTFATGEAVCLASEPALVYLQHGRPDAATLLAPPPLPDSAEQAADLAEVIAIHSACNSNVLTVAFSEKKFSLTNFAPAIGSFLQPDKFPKTAAFVGRVQSDTENAVDEAKKFWKRPRPYTVKPELANGKLETSFSYPSGHSTESTVMALVLAELFPNKAEAIMGISRDIGWHRVMIARHYPTDIYAGRVFAQAIVRELKANPAFVHDLEQARAELKAVGGS